MRELESLKVTRSIFSGLFVYDVAILKVKKNLKKNPLASDEHFVQTLKLFQKTFLRFRNHRTWIHHIRRDKMISARVPTFLIWLSRKRCWTRGKNMAWKACNRIIIISKCLSPNCHRISSAWHARWIICFWIPKRIITWDNNVTIVTNVRGIWNLSKSQAGTQSKLNLSINKSQNFFLPSFFCFLASPSSYFFRRVIFLIEFANSLFNPAKSN